MADSKSREKIRELQNEIKRLKRKLAEFAPPLELLLKHRGFKIFKKEPSDDLLLPQKKFINTYYEKLKKYSFRLFLRDVIQHQESFTKTQVTKYTTPEVADKYIEFLFDIGLTEKYKNQNFRLRKRPVKSFGPMLEWFICETVKRKFSAEAIWGVKFKKSQSGGDYDIIAKIDGAILYMEVKSSPPKQIYANEITAFFDRIIDLSPEIAVFFMDTELRMKDKIVPMFEDELRLRFPEPLPVQRIEKELFQINNRIFIINAKDSIASNMETVLSRYFKTGTKKFDIV